MKKILYLLLILASFSTQRQLFAQQGWGMRFSSNFNHFVRPNEYSLADNWFSTGVLGAFYRSYNAYGGYEIGLNTVYKNNTGKGFPNLPVVMRDFTKDKSQNVGITALEMDLKVGPRFGVINPKIGYVMGYRFRKSGFYNPLELNEDTVTTNGFYLNLPFGLSADFPTGFGTVGFGAYYYIGILNIRHAPIWYKNAYRPYLDGFYPGGNLNSVNLEITVTFNTNNQQAYTPDEIRRVRELRKEKKEKEKAEKEAENWGKKK